MKKSSIFILLLILAFPLKAQFMEDALRYSNTNGIITPRAAGLNVAYHGISDDMAALYFNPAGLALIGKSEFSIGLGFEVAGTKTDFRGIEKELSRNNSYISHIGLAAPFDYDNSKGALAIAYFYEDGFNNTHEFSAFNTQNSAIFSETHGRFLVPEENWAYQLYLNNTINDENGNVIGYNTPYKDSLSQNGTVIETGGLHNISGGVSFELNEFVSMGFSITGKWGGYDYEKDYFEADDRNVYSSVSIDGRRFQSLQTNQKVSSDLSGVTGSIGLQSRLMDFMRLGVAVKFPTYYEIEETFGNRIDANFTNAQSEFFEWDGQNSYNLRTPFVYSAGVSVHGMGMTFAAGVEYQDASQTEFSDAIEAVEDINIQIVRELIGQTTWGFGLEYKIPFVPLAARAGYSRTTSPYHDDIPNANLSNFSVGGSLYLGKNIRMDGVFRWTDVSKLRTAYGDNAYPQTIANYEVNNSPLNIAIGFTYRY